MDKSNVTKRGPEKYARFVPPANRAYQTWARAWVLAGLFLWIPAPAWGQGAAEADQVIRPPRDEAEGQSLLAALAAEIGSLQPQTEVVPEADTETPDEIRRARAAAANQLLESLRSYQSALRDLLALRAQVAGLTDADAAAKKSAEESAKLQERVNEARAGTTVRPPVVSAEEVDHAEEEWRVANDDLMIRTATRAERLKHLAAAPALKETATAEAHAAQGALLEEASRFDSRIASATNEAERAIARFALRTAQISASSALLRVEQIELEIQRDTHLVEEDDQRLPLLRELAGLLDDRFERLKRIRARGERQRVRDWVDYVTTHPQAVSAYEQAYWPLRLKMIEALAELDLMQERAGTLDRYSEDRFADLTSGLSGETAIWNQFVASLRRRPREQIQERFREIGQRIRGWQTQGEQLRRLADASFDDRADIELRLNELEEEIRHQFRAIKDPSINDLADASVAELRHELAVQKQAFEEELQTIRGNLTRLGERLGEAVQAVAGHAETLQAVRSRMYWAYLRVSDQPLWKYQHRKTVEQWNHESRRQKRERDIAAMRKGVADVSQWGWATLGALVVIGSGSAIWLRGRLLREADALEAQAGQKLQEDNVVVAALSDRLHFQSMRFFASAAPILVPAGLAWCWLRLSPMDGPLPRTVLIFITAVCVAHSLIRTTFGGGKPRFRLLPCSSVVARYYQRWLHAMLWVSVVMLPVPLFLTVMEWAFYPRSYMWAAYQTLMLVLFLVFLSRKQTILRVVGRPENVSHPALLAMISALYPLFFLYMAGQLAAQALGYSALTTYLIAATTASLGTLVAAAFLLKYVNDLLQKLQQRLRRAAEKTEEAASASETDRAAAGHEAAVAEAATPMDTDLPIGLLKSVLRISVWCLALIFVLGFWGIHWVDLKGWMNIELAAPGQDGRPPITVGRALLAVLVVVGSWTISRSVRSVLETKVFPTYANLDRGGQVAVKTVLHYLLLLIGLYFAMYLMRIPLGAVTVVLGTLGLGLGLASQPLFMNFLSGLIMLFERHVKVGDIVDIDGVLGEVTNISIRATTIKTFDNVDMVVPNSDFVGRKVLNWTLHDQRTRGKLEVGVGPGSDPRLVEKLLLQVARESPLVLREPAPRVQFTNFGEKSLDFVLYAWFRNVGDRWDFLTDARFRIVELFGANGIEVPVRPRTAGIKESPPLRETVVSPPAATQPRPAEPRHSVQP